MPLFKKSSAAEKTRSFLPTFFVSVVFGVIAGAAGTLIVLPYVVASVVPHGPVSQMSGEVTRLPAVTVSSSAFEPAGRATVNFAFAKPVTNSLLAQSYVPGDAVASGVVLTSDGWLATAGAVPLPKSKKVTDLVAIVLGHAYPVNTMVRDTYSGVSFMKVDAENLPVTGFGSSDAIQPGDTLYAFDAGGGLHPLTVLAYDILPAKTTDDQLRSSEGIQRVLRVSGNGIEDGAMILDDEGAIVGIASGADVFGIDVVPIEGFSDVIGTVLREKNPSRPLLGVHYLDLSSVATTSNGQRGRGAMVAGSDDGKIPAVLRTSPAEQAGLRAGDIITAIDGDQVSTNNPLGDAIAQYSPGDTVSLSVQRGTVSPEITVQVILGTVSAQ
jgi:S1-C subfamily serine protease